MTRALALFDDWVERGPFSATDLGRYRVLLATSMLVGLASFNWVAAYPDSLYSAPPGPFRLFTGFPPREVLLLLEAALAVSLGALALGVRTGWASVSVAVLLLLGSGFSFSLGKIDHTIFSVLVPVVLALGRWGSAVSVDALRAARPRTDPQQQWPLRLLALLVGAGLFTAAVPKVVAGWLSPATQAVRETALRQFYVNGRTDLLAGALLDVDSRWLWESLDWATVLMEALVVVAVLDWRAFRCGLAVLTLFHVGVYLTMNIAFTGNVLVYAAFVPWSRIRLPLPPASLRAALERGRWPLVLVLVLGMTSWAASQAGLDPSSAEVAVVMGAGAATAGGYLVLQARGVLRARTAPVAQDVRTLEGAE